MPTIFGVDIKSIVAEAVSAAGGLIPGTLTHTETPARDATQPTKPQTPTVTTHAVQAMVAPRSVRLPGSAVFDVKPVATISAAASRRLRRRRAVTSCCYRAWSTSWCG